VDQLAHVSLEPVGGVPVARLHGDIDISNAQDLGDALAAAVENDAFGLVLDLSQLDYLDSAGVHLILDLAGRLRTRRQQLHAVAPADAPLRMVLDITAVEKRVPLHEHVEDAVNALRGDG
jgi:anti-sigma B factor antagonist